MKAKIEACFGVAVTRNDPENTAGPTKVDASGRRIETVAPGMVIYTEPGEDVKTISPSGTASAFDPFTVNGLMATAVGAGLTYHLISGDLRQANYSSLRAGNIPTNLGIEQIQWHTIIPQLCAPVWARFIRNGKLSGALKDERAGPVEWIPPAIPANDPLKDLEADLLAVRTGRLTWPKFVSAWGFDPREQLAEIAEWNKAFDAAEVILETDPRKVTRTGVTQGGANNAVTPEA
jgi:capsid protein